ncbi:succinate dehydrogenase cytochrome b subunit [Streptomyces sp. NRRL F-5126]|uniref:succinate dehydrogenase cytochrome b subunit n=1 Tax=Streptomyces sp. NRRL F-5126 TaxID=1463857 RepID=UPI00069050ED|nr:succinate dehydrogenase cytochrome b subunit [Streptomyces sp. NRRL F-5126]
MALATRTDKRPSLPRTVWDSTVGKKTVMAVSGLLMLAYLVAHMYGNLKIFFGPGTFDGYAHWLRVMGEPLLHYAWALWIIRVVLAAAVVAHAVTAYQLSRRDRAARPTKYVHRKARTSYATRTMRWGGVILGLFIVWHILDLTTGTVQPGFVPGHPYANVVAAFHEWWNDVVYIVAMLALGLHIQHGFWSAAQTLGAGSKARDRTFKTLANLLALVLTLGFVAVPVAVMTGLVS